VACSVLLARRILSDPSANVIVVEHRDRLARGLQQYSASRSGRRRGRRRWYCAFTAEAGRAPARPAHAGADRAGGDETSTRHQPTLDKTGTAPPQGEAA
jgi:hypothetical protein